MELSFFKRASLTRHLLAQKLFKLMEDKKTNLAIALDVTSEQQLLKMADELGPFICVLKTHVDILDDFTPDFGKRLQAVAKKHNFLIFEDRKFADIGQTVSLQYKGGLYRIADWADIVNAHIVPGPGIIEGLKMAGKGLLLIAEMSSAGTLAKGAYAKKAVKLAEEHSDYVMGFICQHRLSAQPGMIHFTPGVKLEPGKDTLGQRYRPLGEIDTDVFIIGRDITHSKQPKKQAELYRDKAWKMRS